MKRILMLTFILMTTKASYAETLDVVESQVYELNGSIVEIATKAKSCVAQIVRINSGQTPITDADLQGGTIVASNQLKYDVRFMISYTLNTTITVLVKEGRFKIRNTNIDQTLPTYGRNKIYKGWGTGWQAAETALIKQSDNIATCIMSESSAKENW